MTTRRDTKKFQAFLCNPKVAVLVHDFNTSRSSSECGGDSSSGSSSEETGTCSVTVYGDLTIVSGEKESIYRDHHMKCNPKYKTFIEGDNIAVVVIQPSYARICDIKDQVSIWTPSTKS